VDAPGCIKRYVHKASSNLAPRFLKEKSWLKYEYEMYDGDQEEIVCGKCEKLFKATADVTRTYSTEKIEDKNAQT